MTKLPLRFLLFLGATFLLASPTIISCSKKFHHARHIQSQYALTDQSGSDSLIDALISPYRLSLTKEMNEVVGRTEHVLELRQPESPLGNLLADMLYTEALEVSGMEVDFAILNYKGIRQPQMAKGDITKGAFFELMPFDNQLVILHLDSSGVAVLIRHVQKAGGWPVSQQIRIESTKDEIQHIIIGQEQLTSRKTYYVAMPDYVANGGDGFHFLRAYTQWESGKFMRDLYILHSQQLFEQGKPLEAYIDGRFQIN